MRAMHVSVHVAPVRALWIMVTMGTAPLNFVFIIIIIIYYLLSKSCLRYILQDSVSCWISNDFRCNNAPTYFWVLFSLFVLFLKAFVLFSFRFSRHRQAADKKQSQQRWRNSLPAPPGGAVASHRRDLPPLEPAAPSAHTWHHRPAARVMSASPSSPFRPTPRFRSRVVQGWLTRPRTSRTDRPSAKVAALARGSTGDHGA